MGGGLGAEGGPGAAYVPEGLPMGALPAGGAAHPLAADLDAAFPAEGGAGPAAGGPFDEPAGGGRWGDADGGGGGGDDGGLWGRDGSGQGAVGEGR